MYDDIAFAIIGFIFGGAGGYFVRSLVSRKIEEEGVEPVYITGRGDRSSHTHIYDTMDIASNGKWVCGICRKVKPQ